MSKPENGLCCTDISEVKVKMSGYEATQAAHAERFKEGDSRITRLGEKVDKLIFLQYGTLLAALAGLAAKFIR